LQDLGGKLREDQSRDRRWNPMTPLPDPTSAKVNPDRWEARTLMRFLRGREGGAATEFALVAAPFIALVLAILQVGLIYFAQQALETDVEASARQVLTGQALSQGLTQSQFANVVCTNNPGLFTCGNFMIDLQPATSFANAVVTAPTLTFDSSGKVTNAWQYNLGGPNQIMVMRVMYMWPVFLGPLGLNLVDVSNNTHLLMSTAVFRNEPT
jgi:Flp pilus assembly protein TadG